MFCRAPMVLGISKIGNNVECEAGYQCDEMMPSHVCCARRHCTMGSFWFAGLFGDRKTGQNGFQPPTFRTPLFLFLCLCFSAEMLLGTLTTTHLLTNYHPDNGKCTYWLTDRVTGKSRLPFYSPQGQWRHSELPHTTWFADWPTTRMTD